MKKILVFGMYETAMYHPLTGVDECIRRICPEMAFTFTDQIMDLCSLSAYDGVISYWDDWNHPIPDAASKSLLHYVEQGGPLLILHNGISIQLQDSLENMMGGRFLTHPQQEELTFSVREDVLTRGCEDFSMVEEPYQFELEDDGKELLLTYRYRGREYPAGWKKAFGKGRLIYLAPGHTPSQFQNKAYVKLIRNCMEELFA